MEAFNFTVANDDCCLYSYDMRKLSSAVCVHKDFVSAVMDVDYSPTGREFVAGSYDRCAARQLRPQLPAARGGMIADRATGAARERPQLTRMDAECPPAMPEQAVLP